MSNQTDADAPLVPAWPSRADEDDIDQYTTGECHVLAVSLHRRFGWPLLLVLDHGEPYWADPDDPDNTIPSVCHVYALDPQGRAWDVRGVRPAGNVREDVGDWCHVLDYGEEILGKEDDLRCYVGYWAEEGDPIDRPLHDYSQADLDEAWQVACRIFGGHPDFRSALDDQESLISSRRLAP